LVSSLSSDGVEKRIVAAGNDDDDDKPLLFRGATTLCPHTWVFEMDDRGEELKARTLDEVNTATTVKATKSADMLFDL